MKRHLMTLKRSKAPIYLYCLLALSAVTITYTVVMVNSITHEQSVNYDNHIRYLIANALFRQGTDLLTEAVRRYVVSGDRQYIERYFSEVNEGRHRDRALETVNDLEIDQPLKDTLNNAMRASRNLMDNEYHAMRLVALNGDESALPDVVRNYPLPPEERKMSKIERKELAMALLWHPDYKYTKIKSEIYYHLSSGHEEASLQAIEQNQKLRKRLFHVLALGAISLIVMGLTICGFFLYRRYQHERVIEAQAEENARMNVRLKEERDKALKAEKARSYFFSTVSHDIRTPLNSIIGFSEMLQLGIEDPEEKEKALDAIITSGQTLLELINDVLDLSKLESGKMELHPVPTDVASLVEKVANAFNVATSRTSVPLRAEVGKMPYLKLDPQRIRQILFNLIGNAVKFTAKGAITVRASYDKGLFTLSVNDTGCGISEENIRKLMSPYVQLQEHDSTKGTGLGLAICKQLATQMKGVLELKSTVGEGSTFTLRVPDVEALSDTESEAYVRELRSAKTATRLEVSITEKTILVVDDQKLNQRILQTMLSRLGIHQVLTAENGKAALEVLNGPVSVDIVLTDMTMPVMDGAGLVREIRNSPKLAAIPVYVITADVEMQNAYAEMGFDEMLIKPITLDRLKELLVKYSPHRPLAVPAGNGTPA